MTDRSLYARPDRADSPAPAARTKHLLRLSLFAIMWAVVAVPTALFHLFSAGFMDTPGSIPISSVQAVTAAAANTLGPWAGHAVHAVDFPNAGLRSFKASYALGLTAVFVILVLAGTFPDHRPIRWTAVALFALYLPIWYGYGFFLIIDGMM